MITKEDLNTIENLFEKKVGKVRDCILRDNVVFVYSYIRPKSANEFAPLEQVRLWFGQASSGSNEVSVKISFDVDDVWNIVTKSNPIMPTIDSLIDLSSKYDYNFFGIKSFKLSNWTVSGMNLTSPLDNYIIFEFNKSYYEKGKRIEYKLHSIHTYDIDSQFKLDVYQLPQSAGGEIPMKVFGEWLVTLVNSLIDKFKECVSLPVLLNEIAKELKDKMLERK